MWYWISPKTCSVFSKLKSDSPRLVNSSVEVELNHSLTDCKHYISQKFDWSGYWVAKILATKFGFVPDWWALSVSHSMGLALSSRLRRTPALHVSDLMQDVARFTCSYHLSRWLWRTAVISAMPSFWRICYITAPLCVIFLLLLTHCFMEKALSKKSKAVYHWKS